MTFVGLYEFQAGFGLSFFLSFQIFTFPWLETEIWFPSLLPNNFYSFIGVLLSLQLCLLNVIFL